MIEYRQQSFWTLGITVTVTFLLHVLVVPVAASVSVIYRSGGGGGSDDDGGGDVLWEEAGAEVMREDTTHPAVTVAITGTVSASVAVSVTATIFISASVTAGPVREGGVHRQVVQHTRHEPGAAVRTLLAESGNETVRRALLLLVVLRLVWRLVQAVQERSYLPRHRVKRRPPGRASKKRT